MTGRVTVVGGDTFARTMAGFADDVRDLGDAHAAAGAAVLTAAQGRVRRRTGALAASLAVRVDAAGPTIGTAIVYAGVQEFGWARRNITPSLALTSSLDDSADRVESIYAGAVDGAMANVRGA